MSFDVCECEQLWEMHQTMYGEDMGATCSGLNSPEGIIATVTNLAGGEGVPTMGAPAPVRFAHWQAPEYGNVGESAWTMAFQAAALAISIANGVAQQQIADKHLELADGWYQHARYKWNRFKNAYMPLEKQLLKEVSNTAVPKLDCDGAETRAEKAVDSAYNIARAHLTRQAKALHLCMHESLTGFLDYQKNVIDVDSRNYNFTDDRWFKDYKDDKRWNRRSNVLNLGRNMDAAAMQYGQAANAIYGQVGAQIDKAANALTSTLGYYGSRHDTYFPTTYLGSMKGSAGSIVQIGTPQSVNPTMMNPAGGTG